MLFISHSQQRIRKTNASSCSLTWVHHGKMFVLIINYVWKTELTLHYVHCSYWFKQQCGKLNGGLTVWLTCAEISRKDGQRVASITWPLLQRCSSFVSRKWDLKHETKKNWRLFLLSCVKMFSDEKGNPGTFTIMLACGWHHTKKIDNDDDVPFLGKRGANRGSSSFKFTDNHSKVSVKFHCVQLELLDGLLIQRWLFIYILFYNFLTCAVDSSGLCEVRKMK